jgi:SAM-dependent methyltransferase
MTTHDLEWFRMCCARGLVKDRMLEIGSARLGGSPNLCDESRQHGLTQAIGTDLENVDGVDCVIDFSLCPSEFRKTYTLGLFSTVCIFNVLEHTFDPVTVLGNALSCVDENGTLLVVAPSIWPIHNYPGDYNRLLPDWYREFAKRSRLALVPDLFCWLSQFGIEPVSSFELELPTYISRRKSVPMSRYWISRITHKALNTFGRSHWAANSAIGAAFLCK